MKRSSNRMNNAAWRRTTFLVALALVSEIYGVDTTPRDGPYDSYEDYQQPYVTAEADEQYIRHVHSMFDAYRAGVGGAGRLVIETNALVDTKYRTWKRNADLINSLLALPKGMNDAGR